MDAPAMLAQAERVDGCASRLHHAGYDAAALSLSRAADKIRRRAETGFMAEFPDYDAASLPAIPAGFEDRSWANELCPSFIHEGLGLLLWCDYREPAKREFPESPRFLLQRLHTNDAQHGWQLDDKAEDLIADEDFVFVRDLLDDVESGTDIARAAMFARLRHNSTTVEDARALLAEELAAERPCPDLIREMRLILAAGDAAPSDPNE